jgi:SAM-dependent methyltransferase
MSIYTKQNSLYLQQNQNWHIGDSPWKATQILKIIHRNHLKPQTIAEIGCGAGEILHQLHQRLDDKSIEFSGYDIAPDVIQFWNSRTKPGLTYFLEDLTHKEIHYDLLLVIDVFEHVEDYFGFLKNCKHKAGYKIFHIPLDISIVSILRNMPMYLRNTVGHLHYFTKETALATLKDCGYEILDYFYTPGSLELDKKKFRTHVMNVPRKIFFKLNQDWTQKILGGYSILVLAR